MPTIEINELAQQKTTNFQRHDSLFDTQSMMFKDHADGRGTLGNTDFKNSKTLVRSNSFIIVIVCRILEEKLASGGSRDNYK